MSDDDQSRVEVTCPSCDTIWNETPGGEEATCPECGEGVPMTEHGP